MNVLKTLSLALLLLFSAGLASAHGVRTHVGVYVGPPVVWGGYYYPPSYYYPPQQVIVVPPSQPPVYIEQSPPAEPAAPQYWYYCKSAKAYYPYVKECPDGWQRVLPQPEK